MAKLMKNNEKKHERQLLEKKAGQNVLRTDGERQAPTSRTSIVTWGFSPASFSTVAAARPIPRSASETRYQRLEGCYCKEARSSQGPKPLALLMARLESSNERDKVRGLANGP